MKKFLKFVFIYVLLFIFIFIFTSCNVTTIDYNPKVKKETISEVNAKLNKQIEFMHKKYGYSKNEEKYCLFEHLCQTYENKNISYDILYKDFLDQKANFISECKEELSKVKLYDQNNEGYMECQKSISDAENEAKELKKYNNRFDDFKKDVETFKVDYLKQKEIESELKKYQKSSTTSMKKVSIKKGQRIYLNTNMKEVIGRYVSDSEFYINKIIKLSNGKKIVKNPFGYVYICQ